MGQISVVPPVQSYLIWTHGNRKDLVQILAIDDEGVLLENCKTQYKFKVKFADFDDDFVVLDRDPRDEEVHTK